MTALLPHLALLGLIAAAQATSSQALSSQAPASQTSAPATSRSTLNRTLVFLDPAHGGDDSGAHMPTPAGEQLLEKDITLALSNRIRFQLSSLGLTVLSTREPESSPPVAPATAAAAPTPDQRAGLANHAHPFACIVLHATGTGSGVHLITSALPLPQSTDAAGSSALVPWDSAQAAFLQQSDRLAAELATAITRAGVTVHTSHATLRPLDSLSCPAVVIELAPLPSASVADSGYQARIAQAVATALLFWRGHVESDTSSPETSPGAGQP